ncbi:MAG: signal peptidase II [Bacteroidales bacterium]|nr:signal peptidase II [Candidatus Hennigimonas equi]
MARVKASGLVVLGTALVVLDQITKILVKTNMSLGDYIPVIGDFLRICFVENEGMAFGLAWGGVVGKILLSVFRIVLFGFLCWWIAKLLKPGKDEVPTPTGVLVGLTLIAAGALGNIIDCWFYGLIFDYAPFMMGKVVDMISFSIFPPVFNVADSCVTCGAVYLVLFHWKFFSK